MTNREEIERRRTFAIISHPDVKLKKSPNLHLLT